MLFLLSAEWLKRGHHAHDNFKKFLKNSLFLKDLKSNNPVNLCMLFW